MSRPDRGDELARAAEARLSEVRHLELQTEALEQQLEEYAHRLDDLEDALSGQVFEQEIEPGLGTVKLNGAGQLIDIKLDRKAIRLSNVKLLGDRIIFAISSAEGLVNSNQIENIELTTAALLKYL